MAIDARHATGRPSPPPATLDDILTLVGRLDDDGGFDSARERFRRFLGGYGRHAGAIRAFIEQCQHVPGEQHQRALRDLMTAVGTQFGFDVSFGDYTATNGAARSPVWRSRSAEFVLDVRTAHASSGDASAGAGQPARALSLVPDEKAVRPLVVLAPLGNRARLEDESQSADPQASAGFVTIGTLLSLADMIPARRLTHEEIVRLLTNSRSADFVVALLERPVAPVDDPLPGESSERVFQLDRGAPADGGPAHWIVTVGRDDGLPPEQFLQLVVGRRLLFGVPDDGALSVLRSGDHLAFHIVGKGVVGRADIRSVDATSGGLRDARRFRHVLQLRGVVLTLDEPVALDAETTLRVRATGTRAGHTHTFTRVSPERFAGLLERPADSVREERGNPAERPDPSPEPDVAVSAGNSD